LLNTIKGEDPFVLRPRLYSGGLPGYRNAREVRSKWSVCDGEIITGALASSLHELGIVSLGYSQPDALESQQPLNPDAFMLTKFGARILALAAKHSAPRVSEASMMTDDKRSLVVQPNFELLLLHPHISTLYSLLPFAQIHSVGLVSRLTLTRNSVLRGMGAGKSIEQILQFLEEHSQKGVPQNVDYTLRDWTRLYKEARISQVFLIEVTSESLANEICMSPKLQELGLRRLGPSAIAARSDIGLQELRRALDKEGFVVRITGNVATGRDNRMLIYGRLR
jgi:hypothetical protein